MSAGASGEADGGVEVELAYTLVEANDASRYLTVGRLGPFSAAAAALPIQVEDRYVDTIDGALARAGFAARLRRGPGGSTVLSVKSLASSSGPLHRRTELEGHADVSLDPASWPPSVARSLVLELCGDAPLGEIVTIRQVRRRRELTANGTSAELTLDEVEIVNRGDVLARFSELEVELTSGDERPLRELEDALSADERLVPSERSKFERALEAIGLIGPRRQTGNRLIAPALGQLVRPMAVDDSRRTRPDRRSPASGPVDPPATPKGPGVRGDDTLAAAGRKVLAFHFERLVDRAAGVREGHDPGELKSMRVATRRMRAAWRVFGDAFRRSKTRKLESRLRELAHRLGDARDLDVLLDGLEAHRAALPAEHARLLDPLADAWRATRDASRAALIELLDSDDYGDLVEDYRAFLAADEGAIARVRAESGLFEPRLVRETAPSRIWAAEEHVRAFEPAVATADVPALHRLRIATKRLRYTIEFFREAIGPESAALVERCVAVQDLLGALNDAHVTAGLLREFLAARAAELTPAEIDAVASYLVSQEASVTTLHEEFVMPWSALLAPEFRAALGRAVATL